MPTDTFFNLPDKKRERVIEAAIDEFADRPYHKARITAITDKAEIAKGSFYQYFEDKKDLYKHIIELSVNKKLAYINQEMIKNRKEYSFFQLLREVYLSGIRFAKEHPRLLSIGNMLASNKEMYREILGDYKEESFNFFYQLLKQGIEGGDLDSSINLKLAAKFLTTFNFSLADFIYDEDGIDLTEMEVIDEMLYIIENGIKNRS